MKITNSVEKNGYPQLIQDCNASTIEEIIERVLHSITGKFDSAVLHVLSQRQAHASIAAEFSSFHAG